MIKIKGKLKHQLSPGSWQIGGTVVILSFLLGWGYYWFGPSLSVLIAAPPDRLSQSASRVAFFAPLQSPALPNVTCQPTATNGECEIAATAVGGQTGVLTFHYDGYDLSQSGTAALAGESGYKGQVLNLPHQITVAGKSYLVTALYGQFEEFSGHLEIPAGINLIEDAFNDSKITSLTFAGGAHDTPLSIKSSFDHLFNLTTSVTLPANLTLVTFSFRQTGVPEFTFTPGPHPLTLGDLSFGSAPALQKANLPGNLVALDNGIFSNSNLQQLIFANGAHLTLSGGHQPALTIYDSLNLTPQLGKITFPDHLTVIERSLQNSGVTSINFREGVHPLYFWDETGKDCQHLTGELVMPGNLAEFTSVDLAHITKLTFSDSGGRILSDGQSAKLAVDNIIHLGHQGILTFPDQLAFLGTIWGTNPDDTTTIPKVTGLAFRSGLNDLSIGTAVHRDSTISGTIVFPENLVEIAFSAFAQTSLTEIIFTPSGRDLAIGHSAFGGIKTLNPHLTLPANLVSLDSHAFYQDYFTGEVTSITDVTLLRRDGATLSADTKAFPPGTKIHLPCGASGYDGVGGIGQPGYWYDFELVKGSITFWHPSPSQIATASAVYCGDNLQVGALPAPAAALATRADFGGWYFDQTFTHQAPLPGVMFNEGDILTNVTVYPRFVSGAGGAGESQPPTSGGTSSPPTTGSGGNENHPSSPPACDKTAPAAPAPTIYQAQRLNQQTIKLLFIPGGQPLSHYHLRYGLADHPFTFGTRIDHPQTGSVTISALTNGQTYHFQLIPFNDCASGPDSNIFPVTLGATSGGGLIIKQPLVGTTPLTAPSTSPTPSATPAAQPAVATGQLSPPASKSGSFLGNFSATASCRFAKTWLWWLCWPWWLLLLVLIIGFSLWWHKLHQKNPAASKR